MVNLAENAVEEVFQRFAQVLDSQNRMLREALGTSWEAVEEANFVPSNTVLNLRAQSDNEEEITFIMAYAGVAAGNGGLIVLGDADKPHQIPFPGQTVFATQTRLRLKNTSTRQIQSVVLTNGAPTGVGPAGYLYLALFGREVPIGALRW